MKSRRDFAVFKIVQNYAGKLPVKWYQIAFMENSNKNPDFNFVCFNFSPNEICSKDIVHLNY